MCIKVVAFHECQKSCGTGKDLGLEHSVNSCGGKDDVSQQFQSGIPSVKSSGASCTGCCASDLPEINDGDLETNVKDPDNRSCQDLSNDNAKFNLKATKIDPVHYFSCRVSQSCGGKSSPEPRFSACQAGCCKNEPDEIKKQPALSGKCSKGPRDLASQEKCCGFDAAKREEQHCVQKTNTTCSDACCTHSEQSTADSKSLTSAKGKDECEISGQSISRACQSHLESAFKKYASYLEIGRCICRSVLGPQEICCSQERRKSALQNEANSRYFKISGDRPSPQMAAKCASKPTGISTSVPVARPDGYPFESDHEGGCAVTNQLQDVEKAERSTATHVSINISGMTCTSCAKKGMNILNQMQGVMHPQINFITSSGEFDIGSQVEAYQIISQFERETGFKCNQIMQDNQEIGFLMSKSEAQQLKARMPVGVHSISKANSTSYRVKFDPTLISARTVLSLVPSEKLAPPRNDGILASDRKRLHQMMWSTALAATLTVPVVVLGWSHTSVPYSTRSVVSFVLATCVQAIAVPEFYVGALKSAIYSRVIEMDMLVVMSITAAYGYSVIAFALTHDGYALEQKEFFETSTLLITLVLAGRLVSVLARMRAINAVSVKSLQAESALLVNQVREACELDARLLQYDDSILVPPHTRVVTDGKIISGFGDIDESMVTGESIPTAKGPGDPVIAGTINGSSPLTIRLTRLPGKNSITDIADLVQNALNTKPRTQELADMVASWFVPTVVAISIVVFVIWLLIALKIQKKDGGGSVGLALTYGIAVLAISCPCALGLAVPMVLIIAGGIAAKSGIIIKHATATERAYRTTDVVFDKTGTLTTGLLEVVEEYYGPILQPNKAKALVLSTVRDNGHPVSSAVAEWLKGEKETPALENIQSISGAGLQAVWKGKVVKAGNPYWLGIDTHTEIAQFIQRGMTILGITLGPDLVAAYGLKSTLRSEAPAVIHELSRREITCHIVSGDGPRAVEDVALALGINEATTASRQTPSNKRAYVQNLLNDQHKTILFCGDGTNDAIAIAQAHIGVQIGSSSASHLSRDIASVVLTGLDGIPLLLDLSKSAVLRIRLNFIWAGVYNFFAILLAAGAFVNARVSPAYAGLGEVVSVLPVVLVAVSLMGFSYKRAGIKGRR